MDRKMDRRISGRGRQTEIQKNGNFLYENEPYHSILSCEENMISIKYETGPNPNTRRPHPC